MKIRERFQGSFFAGCIGDAMGAPVEFKKHLSFPPVIQYMEGGSHNLMKGMWTDDTSILVNKKCLDGDDQMQTFLKWYDNGYLSSTGYAIGCGGIVSSSLVLYRRIKIPFQGPTDENTAGNGSLMRILPVALFYFNHPTTALEKSGEASKLTHGAPAAVDACRYLTALIIGALQGKTKEELLCEFFNPTSDANYWENNPLQTEGIINIAKGTYKNKNIPEIKAGGFVVHTLECALWALYTTSTFKEGCLKIVNLGEDSDTVACVYGQLAGALYGVTEIPLDWIKDLFCTSLIECITDALYFCTVSDSGSESQDLYSQSINVYNELCVLFSEITTSLKDYNSRPIGAEKINERIDNFKSKCKEMENKYPTSKVVSNTTKDMQKVVEYYKNMIFEQNKPKCIIN